MTEENKELINKLEEISYALLGNAAIKKAKLEEVKEIYQNYKEGKLTYPYDEDSIKKAANFIYENGYFNNLSVPYANKSDGVKKNYTIEYGNTKIVPNKKFTSKEEFLLLIGFLLDEANALKKNGDIEFKFLGIDDKGKKFMNIRLIEMYESWSKALFDFFLKCYDELSSESKKNHSYYEILNNFIDDPTVDKYNDLMSKVSYLKSVVDPKMEKRMKFLIKDYLSVKNVSEKKKKETSFHGALMTREERITLYEGQNDKTYSDMQKVQLNSKQESMLKEIYEFVCALDKDDFKEFVADPLAFFSHISEDERLGIINNFIIMLEQDGAFKNKETIRKRLIKG